MIDRRTIFEMHHLANDGFSVRKIATTLRVSRQTVKKYLDNPTAQAAKPTRQSKLDPFKDDIARMLEADPKVSAAVVRQRLQERGFEGGATIVRDYLSRMRPNAQAKAAFIRFESDPGVQCQIDWGHFGSVPYGHTQRKLYCLAVIECYSRLLYLEFTHPQRQETLHRGLLGAFRFFQGTAKELVHDNMLTAVIEHQGPVVRFNEQFLEFLRPFHINPIACNVNQPQEKGKVEKGAIHYIRHNFWPLRSFTTLDDLQAQANQWRDQVANRRVHRTTGFRPIERFDPQAMRPLPEFLPDCRDTAVAKVHRDFAVQFDGNAYSAPPWVNWQTPHRQSRPPPRDALLQGPRHRHPSPQLGAQPAPGTAHPPPGRSAASPAPLALGRSLGLYRPGRCRQELSRTACHHPAIAAKKCQKVARPQR